MSLFRRFTRPAPRVDADGWNPEAARMRAAAERRDWPAMRELLTGVPDGLERTALLQGVTDVAGTEEWLPEVIEAERDPALALLVSGTRGVSWAWEARTAARAKHVSKEQFATFHERLRLAEEQLYEAAEREPDWATPWFQLQICGRDLEVGHEAARHRFEAAVHRCPGHVWAYEQQLQQVCAKWGGSHEEMHEFARTSMLKDSEGGALGVLVALAHLEHWLDLDSGPDAEYIRDPDVAAQLHEAARRSVFHAAYERGPGWIQQHNVFAMAFSLAGQEKAAADVFKVLEGRVTEFPWQYVNSEPVKAFRTWRDRAGG